MNILALHLGHDGSITLISDNEVIVHHQLERFNKFKHQSFFNYEVLQKVKDLKVKIDKIVITSLGSISGYVIYFLRQFFNVSQDKTIVLGRTQHHLFHAYCVKFFYQLDKNFIVFVADGDGAEQYLNHHSKYLNGLRIVENESIFNENIESIYNKYYSSQHINFLNNRMKIKNSVSLGKGYQKLTYELGLQILEEGKTMALSSHGKIDKKVVNNLIHLDDWNKDLIDDNWCAYDQQNIFNRYMLDPNVDHLSKDSPSLDFVHSFQKAFEILFLKTLNKVNYKNKTILLSGGCAQNVLNNTNLKNTLDNKILPDPYNGDFGISLGAALWAANDKIKPLRHICAGFKPNQDLTIFSPYKIKTISTEEVAKILIKEPVAIVSGKSEQGQRGLGFRSLLGNPLDKSILNKINKIKKREWYRPFACTVLEEEASKLFEIKSNETSPYMMFVYKSKDKRLKNVCAVDGLSRIQTLNKSFHPKYYDLIKSFKNITNLPAVLNTSLNLPGHVLCEEYNDVKYMMKNSELKYCYIADKNKLIYK
jgi:carbamoyltransferase